MIEQDTIRLLRECDAGVKMGVDAIEEVLPHTKSDALRRDLDRGRRGHQQLQDEIQVLLDRCHDDGKDPNPIARSMSWVKTNVKLGMDESDHTIADLITDGCNMGVKSLSRYLNQYEAASQESKDLTKRVIQLEERMSEQMQQFL